MSKHASLEQRFWQKVAKADPSSCWEWQGARFWGNGYGCLSAVGDNRKQLLAHRVSAEIHFGPLTPGDVVCHHCDNRLCVNPAHLYVGDAKTNSTDMMSRGRGRGQFPSGHRPHNAGQTHCKRGHEYTPENTRLNTNGSRVCRECRRLRAREVTR